MSDLLITAIKQLKGVFLTLPMCAMHHLAIDRQVEIYLFIY
jgi:hypothetical protein